MFHKFLARKTSMSIFSGFNSDLFLVTTFPAVLKRRSDAELVALIHWHYWHIGMTSLARQKVTAPVSFSHFLLLRGYGVTFVKEPTSVCCSPPLPLSCERFAAAAPPMLPFIQL